MQGAVLIEGEIVSSTDETTSWPYTNLAFVREQVEWIRLDELGPDGLRFVINSPGGSTTEGFAIYDFIQELRASGLKVTTEAIGQCASIASVIFAAGEIRKSYPNATFHPHCPWGGISGGTAEQVQQYADDLLDCQNRMVAAYVLASGGDAAAWLELLKKDKDMTPAEALAVNLATIVVQPIKALVRADAHAELVPLQSAPAAPTPSPSPNSKPASTNSPQQTPMATTKKKDDKKPASRSTFSAAATRFLGDIVRMIRDEEIKALTVKTGGDTPVEYNVTTDDTGTMKPGDPIVTAAGDAVADGEITLEDGTVIKVVGGFIETVTAPASASTSTEEEEETDDDLDVETATVDELRAAIKRERGETKAKMTGIEKRLEFLATNLKTGAAAPTVDTVANGAHSSAAPRTAPTGTVADANSAAAKQAAKDQVKANRERKANARKAAGNS